MMNKDFRTSDFTYVKETRSLVSDASDLFGRMFPKSFTVTSDYTGRKVTFQSKYGVERRDSEGYIHAWEWPIPGSKTRLVIIND